MCNRIRPRFDPGQVHSQSLMASNFAALSPTDPKFSALKDLNPFSTLSKGQEAGSILKVFRSFNAENLGSVGQGAAKLPAIKL